MFKRKSTMLFAQNTTSKKVLGIIGIFAVCCMVSLLAVTKDGVYLSRVARSENVTENKVSTEKPPTEKPPTEKPLTERPLTKTFAYYTLTEKCIPPYYLEMIALGNASICDVYVNSYKEACDDKNMPKHVTHIFKKTTWSSGRNLLYYHMLDSGKRYHYHIFLDDDAIPVPTDHIIQFKNANPKVDFVKTYVDAANGLKEGIYWKIDGKSGWRSFEEDLLRESPAYAITNFAQFDVETRLVKQKYFKEVCGSDREMPWILPTFYVDEVFIAFHEEALPIMLPYTTMFEHISWFASGIVHIFRGQALLYRKGVVNYKYTIINHKHRPYPRGGIPNDFLAQYLAGDGKDMAGLIDERDMAWSNYRNWELWQERFMRTKAICTVPIKFPEWKHYRLS